MKFLELTTWSTHHTQEITDLFTKTFTDSEGETEGALIGSLAHDLMTKADRNTLRVFIAQEKDIVVGCIFFSEMTFQKSSQKAYLLAPVAILTQYQGKGIGQKLIHFAHDILKKEGVDIVITYGDIRFYEKVGYLPISEEIIQAPLKLSYPEGWLAQSLKQNPIQSIQGKSFCISEFNNPQYW
jgi:predicted N-acetyltransferase YhbS